MANCGQSLELKAILANCILEARVANTAMKSMSKIETSNEDPVTVVCRPQAQEIQ